MPPRQRLTGLSSLIDNATNCPRIGVQIARFQLNPRFPLTLVPPLGEASLFEVTGLGQNPDRLELRTTAELVQPSVSIRNPVILQGPKEGRKEGREGMEGKEGGGFLSIGGFADRRGGGKSNSKIREFPGLF